MNDSPVVRIGEVWKAKSPLELLDLFGDRITRDQLDRYFTVVREILADPDPVLELPEEERYAARIYGKVRPQSGLLIRALSDTLMKLAGRGPDAPNFRALDIEHRVAALVRDLLHDCDATRWLSLASLLPALAEAAPDAFLDAIEISLARPDAPVTRLLTETSGSGITGHCWHSGLLWGLETLAWAPERLARVSLVLARLSKTSIKGNWGNSPQNSLIDIYRTWLPQTAATLEQRIAVLDRLIEREPEAAVDELYWAECNPGSWLRNERADFEYALRRLLAAKRPRTALQLCHLDLKNVDARLLAEVLERLLRGEESTGYPLDPWDVGEAVDVLEASNAIDRERLVRLEFAPVPVLGRDGEGRCKALYHEIMWEPRLFTKLICLLYKPASPPHTDDVSDNTKDAAEVAWSVLHNCRRQPGTRSDGSVDAEAFVRFIDEARERCREADRIAACDRSLGQIIAHASAGADGVWPFEPAREVLDRSEFEEMRDAFFIGTLNARGMTSRAYDQGGDQERGLASEYRGYARTLSRSHVNVAATLEKLARNYERDGFREDVHAKLRIEGY